jgi:hypothetical protein
MTTDVVIHSSPADPPTQQLHDAERYLQSQIEQTTTRKRGNNDDADATPPWRLACTSTAQFSPNPLTEAILASDAVGSSSDVLLTACLGEGFTNSMVPHDRSAEGVTAYLHQQSFQLLHIQAHVTTHTWMEDSLFPEATIAYRLSQHPPFRGLIQHLDFSTWIQDAMVNISAWSTHQLLRDVFIDYLLEAQQWTRHSLTNSEPMFIPPVFLHQHPLVGYSSTYLVTGSQPLCNRHNSHMLQPRGNGRLTSPMPTN